MTHHESVLSRALDNLIYRIERGQDMANALDATTYLYGVSLEELGEAYSKFCGTQEITHEN